MPKRNRAGGMPGRRRRFAQNAGAKFVQNAD